MAHIWWIDIHYAQSCSLTAPAVIAAEAALSLLDPSHLPELARQGGILTPMVAFGDVLLERLEKTGLFTLSAEILGDSDDEDAKTK